MNSNEGLAFGKTYRHLSLRLGTPVALVLVWMYCQVWELSQQFPIIGEQWNILMLRVSVVGTRVAVFER